MSSRNIRSIWNIIVLIIIVNLSSCSLFTPVPNVPATKYILKNVPSYFPKKQANSVTILVLLPETRSSFNTTQMAYTLRPYQIAYFSQNEWSETPSEMLQPLLLQTLQNSHYFHAVVTPPYVGVYDYVLKTEISQLNQDYTVSPPALEFAIRVTLTNIATNKVAAVKDFSYRVPILPETPYGGVLAANQATASFLQQLPNFILQKIE